jgi:hypothetical protein
MRRLAATLITLTTSAALAGGCDFSTQPTLLESAGSGASGGHGAGSAGSSGTGTGSSSGTGTGASSGGGTVGTTGTGGSMSCGQTSVAIQTLPPDVLILQDKSLSMADNTSGKSCSTPGCSKWSQVSSAVVDVVMATQANVNWGLKFFGNDNMCGVTAGADVIVAPNNYTAIDMAFQNTSPSSYTPTQKALDSASAYLATLTDPNPKFILLATDGLPNCPPSGGSTTDDSTGAEAAVTRAYNAGYPTFVVGIATSSDATATKTLNTMATNGGYPQTGAATSYYSITDTASLEAALNKIVGLVASCTLPLNGAPTNFTNVAVSVQTSSGASAVPQDTTHTNGWDYTNNKTSVQFYGPACDSLKSGTYTGVKFIYACPGVTITIG